MVASVTPRRSRVSFGHAGMGGRGGVAGERFGAPEAHRELEDLEGVQDAERLRLAAPHVEREGRARRLALRLVDAPLRRALGQVGEVVHLRDRRVLGEEGGDDLAVAVGAAHAQRQRLERAAEHPAGMRVELRADGRAQQAHGPHGLARAERRAGDQVRMAADVLRQRVDGDVGPVLQRLLVERPEQGVVADDHRAVALALADLVGDAPHQGDVDEACSAGSTASRS